MSVYSVLILGAGIGGLSAAHSLRKRGFQGSITMLEAHDIIGGQARSSYVHGSVSGGGGVPLRNQDPDTQYCWRIYGPSYKVLRAMMKEIPLIEDPTKSVHDNLVDTQLYLVAGANGKSFRLNYNISALKGYNEMMSKVSWMAKWRLISKFITLVLCCKSRLLSEYDQISWGEYLGQLPHEEKVYAVDATGPILGYDLYNTSANSVGTIIEGSIVNLGDLSVMNGPTSEAWFRHWYKYLTQDLDIQILTNSPVTQIQTSRQNGENKIESVTYLDKQTGRSSIMRADRYICSLPIEVIARLCPQVPSYSLLAQRGVHDMVAMTIYWPTRLTFPHSNTGIWISESPWQLIIQPQGDIWKKPINYKGGKIRDSWNVGLCDARRPGTFVRKPWIDCSALEIYQEIVWQLHNTLSLTSQVTSLDTKTSIKDIQPTGYNLWQGYKQDPKFGPNKQTYNLRPTTRSAVFSNLLFSTVYVSNPFTPILMDQAANAGVMAAKEIIPVASTSRQVDKYASDDRFKRVFPVLLGPFRFVDLVFWQVGLKTPFRFQPLIWLMFYLAALILLISDFFN